MRKANSYRQKSVIALVLGIFVSMCFFSCDSGQGKTVKLTNADNGRSIELNIDDELIVRLRGNPTTGYNWYIASEVENVLIIISEREFFPDSDLIGSGGVVEFRFVAINRGQVKLTFEYKREFENNQEPIESYYNIITVI